MGAGILLGFVFFVYKLLGPVSTSEYCWETPLCIYPVAPVQEVSGVCILEVALVGCRVYKSSALLDNSETSFKSIVTLPTHQQYVKVPIDILPCQQLARPDLLKFCLSGEY